MHFCFRLIFQCMLIIVKFCVLLTFPFPLTAGGAEALPKREGPRALASGEGGNICTV